jgi:uncharacterized protein (TIGR00297 family)
VTAFGVLAGAVLAAAIALAARRAHALTTGGALAAFAVGTITFGAGGVPFAAVLLAFFVSSVALSRLGRARKRDLVDIGKSGPRDARQVLANGGIPTLCAVLFAVTHDARWGWTFAGAYAAATADTWATEIGTLMRQPPRSIFTLRPVATGLSGGITLAGTLAEFAGAVWIGFVFLFATVGAAVAAKCRALDCDFGFSVSGNLTHFYPWLLLGAIPIAGVAGAMLDSALGGSVQELRRCDACGRDCEVDPHVCGARTRLVRGVRGVSNDVVNLLASAAGALVAFGLAA